jgi:hypothetical protein
MTIIADRDCFKAALIDRTLSIGVAADLPSTRVCGRQPVHEA